ncbi:MAG: DNA-directed RNA polymerase subunit B'' [archaeon]
MDYKPVITSYMQQTGLVEHQIDSYNDFLENKLQHVIDEMGLIEPEIENFQIRLENIHIGVPSVKEANGSIRKIFPNEARLRNLTYSAPILLDMTPIKNGVDQDTLEAKIGELPIMLKSNICLLKGLKRDELIRASEDPDDPGGYFVVNGTERVLVLVEDLAANRINLERSTIGTVTESARVFSESGWYRRRNGVERKKDGGLVVNMPPFSKPIPFVVLLRALGLGKDSELAKAVSLNQRVSSELYVSFEEAAEENSTDDALDYLGKKVAFGQNRPERIERAKRILDTFLLPHVGVEPEDRKKKAYYVAKMAEKVIKLHIGLHDIDDKDHYSNKRLRLAGSLFEDLFRVTFRALINNTVYSLEKAFKRHRKISVLTAVRSNFLTERIQHAIATGAWIGNRQGVSQHLDRMNYLSSMSHRRRVRSLLSTTQPHFEARDLHSTHWGRLCPNETPEGSNIGLVKNLALMAKISKYSDDALIEETLRKKNVKLGD